MKRRDPRGMAMVAALMLMALLAIIAIATLSLAAADRLRAIRLARGEARESCAFAGLNYARTYFAGQLANWNTYFAATAQYNPMDLPNTTPPWTVAQVKADLTGPALSALQSAHPELFLDLDSDGAADVYVFIRDNHDEYPPAVVNFQQDNDQNAFVGAACISSTMQPKRDDGSIDTDRLLMESLLSVNLGGSGAWQVGSDGNVNN